MADVQIAIIDQQNTQIALAAPPDTQVTAAVPGVQGPKGEGVPTGGTANQVLFKQSSTNYDTAWGAITSAMIGDLQIVDGDVSTTAAIAGTKISPNFGAQNVVTTGTSTAASFIPTSSTVPTNGVYLPAADQVAISTNGTGRLFVDSSGKIYTNVASATGTNTIVEFSGTSENSTAPEIKISTTSAFNAFFRGLRFGIAGDTTDYSGIRFQPSSGELRIESGYATYGGLQTFYTNGSERMRLDSSGRLGLGTSSPSNILHVAGTSSTPAVFDRTDTTGSFIALKDSASQTFIGNTNGVFSIQTPGSGYSDKLVVTSAGLVGIGTTSPGAILHTVNTSAGAATVGAFIQNSSLTAGTEVRLGFAPNTNLVSDNRYSWIGGVNDTGSNGSSLTFATTPGGQGATERMRITSAGLVGVGTSVPGALVEGRITGGGGTPATSGTSQPNAVFRVSGSGTTGVLDIGCNSGAPWIQSTDRTDLSQKYSLLLNPNGGNVGIGTSSPGATLTVDSSSAALMSTYNSTNANGGYIELRSSGTVYGDIGTAAQLVSSGSASDFCLNGRGSRGLALGTNNVSRLYINSSGNVGIGTTSPTSAQLYVNSSEIYGVRINHATLPLQSFLVNGTQAFSIGANSGGGGSFYYGTGNLTAATIDSSGRLLVGTSSARSNFFNTTNIAPTFQLEEAGTNTGFASFVSNRNDTGGSALLFGKTRGTTVGSNTVVSSGDDVGTIFFSGADGSELVNAASIAAQVDGTPGANDMPGRLVFSTTADGASSPTERMRINNKGISSIFASDGNVLFVRSSSAAATTDYALAVLHSATNTTNGTASFGVFTNGNVVNTNNSYGAISDIKLKENIVDANSQWDDLKALQVRKYNFKEGQTHTQIGLVAQEVELVSPGLVSESPDRDADGNDLGTVTKSVNYSVLYMKAVKALQEAMERIETLEAKVAALESA